MLRMRKIVAVVARRFIAIFSCVVALELFDVDGLFGASPPRVSNIKTHTLLTGTIHWFPLESIVLRGNSHFCCCLCTRMHSDVVLSLGTVYHSSFRTFVIIILVVRCSITILWMVMVLAPT